MTMSKLQCVADTLAPVTHRIVLAISVSEHAAPTRRKNAPSAAFLNGTLLRQEACGLASAVGSERPAVAGFTATRVLHERGAPGTLAPLVSPSVWTTVSATIHPPPSRALARATPGFAGFAEHGWRRAQLGLRRGWTPPVVAGCCARPVVRGNGGGHHSCAPWAACTHFRAAWAALMARRGTGVPRPHGPAEHEPCESERPAARWGGPLASRKWGRVSDRNRQAKCLASRALGRALARGVES